MRPRCPSNIWKVCVCVCRCSLTFLLLMPLRVCTCGCASGFLHTSTNTHFTHNPWHFLSWSHVSDLIGYRIKNTAPSRLPPHLPHITYRRFDWLSLHLISAQVSNGADLGLASAPSIDPAWLGVGPLHLSMTVDFIINKECIPCMHTLNRFLVFLHRHMRIFQCDNLCEIFISRSHKILFIFFVFMSV